MQFMNFQDLSSEKQKELWTIYETSFPTHERRPLKDHVAALKDKRFHAQAVMDRQQITALLFYWDLPGMCYIEHFAVCPSLRGQNYGSRILKKFCELKKNIILEIEPPEDEITKKREHFYHRLGFRSTPFSYTHPGYRSTAYAHQLVLLSYPMGIDAKTFQAFQSFMFHEIMKYTVQSI